MDSLLELNNDLRFEHFIDESLDIDMSAVAMLPPLHSEPYFNFVDDILTAGAASRRLKSVSPVLEFATAGTHEFLVRFSPEAKKKSSTVKEEEEAKQVGVEHDASRLRADEPPKDVNTIASVKQEPVEEVKLEKSEQSIGGGGRKKNKQSTSAVVVEVAKPTGHEFLVPPAKKKAPTTTKSKALPIEFMCNNCNERFASHIELDKHYR